MFSLASRPASMLGRSIGCLLFLVWLQSPVQAEVSPAALPAPSAFTPIEVTDLNRRYALASASHSSGFVPAPENVALEDALPFLTQQPLDPINLRPDFTQHGRYWLYTKVVNRTDNADWVVHISNLGLRSPKLLLLNQDGQTSYHLGNTDRSSLTDINPLGRAVAVSLNPGESAWIVVEVSANRVIWTPYLALISAEQYQHWSHLLELAYLLALGVILGMITLALACWAVTRQATFFWAALASATMLVYYLQHSYLLTVFGIHYSLIQYFWHIATLTMLSQLAFAASFLQITRRSGWWFYCFAGTALMSVILWMFSNTFPTWLTLKLFALNYVFLWLVVIVSGIAKIRREGSYYVYYLLGWLPPLLSIFHSISVTMSMQPEPLQVEPSYKLFSTLYIQIVHIFLHAMALILRIQKLRADKLRSEFLSNAKSRFIAQSSHDLSQPLNSMGIFLDFLKPHVPQLEGKKILQRLVDTHRQMSGSFKSIMDLGKLEAGAYQTNIKPIALNPVLNRLHREYQILALQKGIQLTFQFTSLSVLSDEELLERMLRNLISNAIKYTDSGKVLVGCRRHGEQVSIEVLDSGRGIDLNEQQHLFDIYQRSAREEETVSGYGIGLSIVQHLSTLLEHPVQVTSIPGRGSHFRIWVSRADEQHPLQPAAGSKPAAMLPVALITQQESVQQAFLKSLKAWDFSVQCFDSLAAAAATDQAFLVLLCEHALLTQTTLSDTELNALTQRQLSAALCESDTTPPQPWVALPTQARPAQLRALLNTALRRQSLTLNEPVSKRQPKSGTTA